MFRVTTMSATLSIALALTASTSFAATTNGVIDFTGTASNACSLANATAGTISLDSTLKNWTTGTFGQIEVTQSGGSQATISITPPSNWKNSPVSAPVTEFAVNASSSLGANTNTPFTDAGSGTKSAQFPMPGVDTLNVSLSATSQDIFPGGNYAAEVTVTCVTN